MVTENRAVPDASVTSAPDGFVATTNRGSEPIEAAISMVGQPSAAAAFHRAVSSAVSPVRSTVTVAPNVRAPSIPMSDIATIGMNPTGLPVASAARTSREWVPVSVGALPCAHTIRR